MAWPTPQQSKNHVRNAGKRVVAAYERDGLFLWESSISPQDYETLLNWRASHGAVLNTAQAWLRRLEKQNAPVVGQRLKRFDTILDKLVTKRSQDLSTMHDIAGVRAIFRTDGDLRRFQEKAENSRAQHRLLHAPEKFNYIIAPKADGYRGVHRVYSRQVLSPSGMPWNGLRFEVQLRTAVQHAWATAIEVYDSTAQARFKFEQSENPAYEQFQVISEMFARVHENVNGCLPNLSDTELARKHMELEKITHMVDTIQSLQIAKEVGVVRSNTILQRTKDGMLNVYHFKSLPAAIRAIPEIEESDQTENAVLVGAATPTHIRDAFRNYFDDTEDFVSLLNSALAQIGPAFSS